MWTNGHRKTTASAADPAEATVNVAMVRETRKNGRTKKEWASVATDVAMVSAEGIVGVILADVICSSMKVGPSGMRPAFV